MKKDSSLKWIIVIATVILLLIGLLFEKYKSSLLSSPSVDSSKNRLAHRDTSSAHRDTSSALPLQYIYLTFDDGPLEGSENIDSFILAEKLKINVFLVGRNVRNSSILDSFYKMYEHNPYIESYNHSYTHANNRYKLFYSNPQNVLADIEENEQALNLHFKIVRLPGRDMWRIGNRVKNDEVSGATSADLLAKNGFKVYGWDLEWQHKNNGDPIQSVDTMYKKIIFRLAEGRTFTKGHLVLLLHDEMFQKPWEEDELKQLIDKLRTHPNFIFEHIRFYPDS